MKNIINVSEKSWSDKRRIVSVLDNRDARLNKYDPDRIEINWSALGSVSIKETEDFVSLLSEAIKVAKEIKQQNVD